MGLMNYSLELQQCLPLAVLKPFISKRLKRTFIQACCNSAYRLRYWNYPHLMIRRFWHWHTVLQQCLPLAVLKLGIMAIQSLAKSIPVATVPTACGIETLKIPPYSQKECYLLQQCLPLAVLKRVWPWLLLSFRKLGCNSAYRLRYWN